MLCVEKASGNGTCNIPVCEIGKLLVTKFGFAEYAAMMQRGRSECELALVACQQERKKGAHRAGKGGQYTAAATGMQCEEGEHMISTSKCSIENTERLPTPGSMLTMGQDGNACGPGDGRIKGSGQKVVLIVD